LPRPGARLHPEWQAHHTRDPHRSVGAGAIYCASGTLAPDRGRPRSSRRVEPRSDLPYRLIRIRRSRREGRAGHGADGAAGSAVAPQIHAGHRRGAFRGAQRVPGANPRSPGAQRDWGRGGDAADDWAHWMAVSLISDRARHPEYEELESPLVTDLLAGRATAKAGPATVTALNEWRSSARDAATQLVFRLTDPADAREIGEPVASSSLGEDRSTANRERGQNQAGDDGAKQFTWRLEVGLSVDGAPATPINTATTGDDQARKIQQRLHQAAKVWPR